MAPYAGALPALSDVIASLDLRQVKLAVTGMGADGKLNGLALPSTSSVSDHDAADRGDDEVASAGWLDEVATAVCTHAPSQPKLLLNLLRCPDDGVARYFAARLLDDKDTAKALAFDLAAAISQPDDLVHARDLAIAIHDVLRNGSIEMSPSKVKKILWPLLNSMQVATEYGATLAGSDETLLVDALGAALSAAVSRLPVGRLVDEVTRKAKAIQGIHASWAVANILNACVRKVQNNEAYTDQVEAVAALVRWQLSRISNSLAREVSADEVTSHTEGSSLVLFSPSVAASADADDEDIYDVVVAVHLLQLLAVTAYRSGDSLVESVEAVVPFTTWKNAVVARHAFQTLANCADGVDEDVRAAIMASGVDAAIAAALGPESAPHTAAAAAMLLTFMPELAPEASAELILSCLDRAVTMKMAMTFVAAAQKVARATTLIVLALNKRLAAVLARLPVVTMPVEDALDLAKVATATLRVMTADMADRPADTGQANALVRGLIEALAARVGHCSPFKLSPSYYVTHWLGEADLPARAVEAPVAFAGLLHALCVYGLRPDVAADMAVRQIGVRGLKGEDDVDPHTLHEVATVAVDVAVAAVRRAGAENLDGDGLATALGTVLNEAVASRATSGALGRLPVSADGHAIGVLADAVRSQFGDWLSDPSMASLWSWSPRMANDIDNACREAGWGNFAVVDVNGRNVDAVGVRPVHGEVTEDAARDLIAAWVEAIFERPGVEAGGALFFHASSSTNVYNLVSSFADAAANIYFYMLPDAEPARQSDFWPGPDDPVGCVYFFPENGLEHVLHHVHEQLWWVDQYGLAVFYVGPRELEEMDVLHLDMWWVPDGGDVIDIRGITDGMGWWGPDVELADANRFWTDAVRRWDPDNVVYGDLAGDGFNDDDVNAVLSDHQLFLTAAACRVGRSMEDWPDLTTVRHQRWRNRAKTSHWTAGDAEFDSMNWLDMCQAQRELIVEVAVDGAAIFGPLVTKRGYGDLERHELESGRVAHQLAVPNAALGGVFDACPVLVLNFPRRWN